MLDGLNAIGFTDDGGFSSGNGTSPETNRILIKYLNKLAVDPPFSQELGFLGRLANDSSPARELDVGANADRQSMFKLQAGNTLLLFFWRPYRVIILKSTMAYTHHTPVYTLSTPHTNRMRGLAWPSTINPRVSQST